MRILFIDNASSLIDQMIEDIGKSYVVDTASNGEEGTYLSQVNDYDAIVVGPTLPDLDSAEICKRTRTAQVVSPILVIPPENCVAQRIAVLDSGADVCVSENVGLGELKAQLCALMRRTNYPAANEIQCADLLLNMRNKTVYQNGTLLKLRRKEFDLLEYLFLHQGKIVSKEELLEHVWEAGIYIFSNTVEVHVRNLRRVLGQSSEQGLIKTVRGFGYTIGS